MDGLDTVEACSWDLTMGAASNVLGKLFLRSTSSSSQSIPDAIDHVGIIVFHRLYEYGHNGIVKSSIPRSGEDPVPQYPGCKLRKREYLGKTNKTRSAFVEWIISVKYGKFKGSHYDMINHNCLDFAKVACEFLGVGPSPNWEKVCNWARTNQRLADVLTRGFRTPRLFRENGRSASLQEEGNINRMTRDDLLTSSPPTSDPTPSYNNLITNNNSPRRRRFSLSSHLHRRLDPIGPGATRSVSIETLPPSYEEALKMSRRKDPIPSYQDLIP